MRSVRISEISCGKYLLGFHLAQQGHGLLDIIFKIHFLGEFSTIVERKVHKMDIFVRKAHKTSTGNGFTLTDQAFDGTDNFRINLIGLFYLEECTRFIVNITCNAVIILNGNREILNKFQITKDIIVPYGCISGCLVRHVHIVPLIRQADKGTTHRNNIIVWVR